MKKTIPLTVLASAALAFAACDNKTADTIKEKSDEAKEAVATKAEEAKDAAGQKIDEAKEAAKEAAPAAAAAVDSMAETAKDATQNAADAVFQGDALMPVVEILRVARRADRLVRQNLGLALIYNLSAVPLAILGAVTPLVAAVAMSSSSLLVIGNALRLGARLPGREGR